MISSHKAADAAKKANLDNMICTHLSKQYGAQDKLSKQSVVQYLQNLSKKKGDPPAKRGRDDKGRSSPSESFHNNYAHLQGPYGEPPWHQHAPP